MDLENNIDFHFEDGPAGCFEWPNVPTHDGIVEYMPYRSPSHYLMWNEVDENQFAQCDCVLDNKRISFRVVGLEEYGKLQVSNVQVQDADAG